MRDFNSYLKNRKTKQLFPEIPPPFDASRGGEMRAARELRPEMFGTVQRLFPLRRKTDTPSPSFIDDVKLLENPLLKREQPKLPKFESAIEALGYGLRHNLGSSSKRLATEIGTGLWETARNPRAALDVIAQGLMEVPKKRIYPHIIKKRTLWEAKMNRDNLPGTMPYVPGLSPRSEIPDIFKPRPTPVIDQIYEMYKERYGSREAFYQTLATDPAGFISDLPLPGIGQAGKIALPAKIVAKIGGFKTAAELAVIGGVIKGSTKIADFATTAGKKLRILKPGEIPIGQLRKWDADENVFYRITTADRLDQQDSFALAEAAQIERQVFNKVRENFDKPVLNLEQAISDKGGILSVEEMKSLYGRRLDNVELEHQFWKAYEAELDAINVKLVPASAEHISQHFSVPSNFKYKGLNASENLSASRNYDLGANWVKFNRMTNPDERVVVQIIRGELIGNPYDSDGKVIIPKKTLAVLHHDILKE